MRSGHMNDAWERRYRGLHNIDVAQHRSRKHVHPGIMLAAVYTPVFGLSHGPRPLNAVLVVGLCIALAWALSEIVARIPRGRAVRLAVSEIVHPHPAAIAESR